MREWENGIGQRERQTNWQLGVKMSLSPPCSHFFAFSFTALYRLFRGSIKVLCTNTFIPANLRVDWKLWKVTIPCKTLQHTHSKPGWVVCFSIITSHSLNSLQMIMRAQKSTTHVSAWFCAVGSCRTFTVLDEVWWMVVSHNMGLNNVSWCHTAKCKDPELPLQCSGPIQQIHLKIAQDLIKYYYFHL